MPRIFLTILLLFANQLFAQEKLSITDCYDLLNKNYPLAKQIDLLAQQNKFALEIIQTEKLPKFDFTAQATYQSEVAKMPFTIPNNPVDPPNKDQYKSTLGVNQLIYDGGLINASAHVKSATLKTQQKQVEVNLYQLKKQVNQLYFSILLMQEKRALVTSKKNLLDEKLKEVKAGVKYGVLLPSSDLVLEAELLKIQQQFLEIDFNKSSLIASLSKLIGTDLKDNIKLAIPENRIDLTTTIQRPEIQLFQLQKDQIETTEQLVKKKNNPKLVGFATGGYGNPGLNMLDNSFQPFYISGIKLNWNVFDWNSSKKEQKTLQVTKELINNQQELFELQTSIELHQQQAEIEKLNAFIKADEQLIELRKQILLTAASQLKNGVITASNYITELTNLYEAENNLKTHQIQLLLESANYLTTQGN